MTAPQHGESSFSALPARRVRLRGCSLRQDAVDEPWRGGADVVGRGQVDVDAVAVGDQLPARGEPGQHRRQAARGGLELRRDELGLRGERPRGRGRR